MTIPRINVYRNRYDNLGYSGIGNFKMQFPLHAMESKYQEPTDPEFVDKLRRAVYKGDKPIAEITSNNVSTGKGGRQIALSDAEIEALRERLSS